jgi:hypothetical protein
VTATRTPRLYPAASACAFSFARNCWTSSNVTLSTGHRGPHDENWLGEGAITVRHSCCVTSYLPRRNGRVISTSCSSSSSFRPLSEDVLPMVNRSGGSSTSVIPVHGWMMVATGVWISSFALTPIAGSVRTSPHGGAGRRASQEQATGEPPARRRAEAQRKQGRADASAHDVVRELYCSLARR